MHYKTSCKWNQGTQMHFSNNYKSFRNRETVHVTNNKAIPLLVFYSFVITENNAFYSIWLGN